MRRYALAAILAVALLSLFALYGCSGGVNYQQCCIRSGIYDIAANPITLHKNGGGADDPHCFYPDGTDYGPCDADSTWNLNGTANCNPNGKLCTQITDERDCSSSTTCAWGIGGCNKKAGTNGYAYYLLPVCTDAYPRNCTTGVCTAMVCGYSSPTVGPPPVSNDFRQCDQITDSAECTGNCHWDPANGICSGSIVVPFSKNSMKAGAINLQGTSCEFKTMDLALTNKFQQAEGKLWVNAFRFGVGKSFADYEQSRYFFPPSDRFCSNNLAAGKDRYLNYVGVDTTGSPTSSWCPQTNNPYYECNSNHLDFADEPTCLAWCPNIPPSPGSPCVLKTPTATTPAYLCKDTGFVYGKLMNCQSECQILKNPAVCPAGPTASTDFPFLDSSGKVLTKLQSDYVYSTNTISSSGGIIGIGSGDWKAACKQESWQDAGGWLDKHYYCNDFNPWICTSDDVGDTCLWNPDMSNSNIEGMQWKDSRVFSLEVDSEQYASKLSVATPSLNIKPFECESSMDCLSGSCDFTSYHRTVCLDKGNPDNFIDCGCTNSQYGVQCSNQGQIATLNLVGTNLLFLDRMVFREKNYGAWTGMEPSPITFADGAGDGQVYYITDSSAHPGSDPANDIKFLSGTGCNIPKLSGPDVECIAQVSKDGQDSYLVVHQGNSGDCAHDLHAAGYDYGGIYIGRVWKYEMDFKPSTSPDPAKQWGSVGQCKLFDTPTASQPPYLQTRTFGWCAACTQSTLAAQKVTFNAANPKGWHFQCLDFRATYDYTVQGGVSNLNVYRDANVAPIKKDNAIYGTSAYDNDGTIARGTLDWYGLGGADVSYLCTDQWTGDWHAITSPSQPYLVSKMNAYMRANIMPILYFDEGASVPSVHTTAAFSGGFPPATTILHNTYYPPVDICSTYGADGTAIYDVTDITDFNNPGTAAGTVFLGTDKNEWDMVSDPKLIDPASHQGYLDVKGDVISAAGGIATLDRRGSAIYRSLLLKNNCPNKPLTAISIVGNEPLDTPGDPNDLIGYWDTSTSPKTFVPGTLHQFFFTKTWSSTDELTYPMRVERAQPDKYANTIDLILQGWEPTCSDPPGEPGAAIDTRIAYEFWNKVNYSRAILGNFSKPTLIWRFHFPQGNTCKGSDGTYTDFLNYVFDHKSDMVDAGITGIMYDSWLTSTGDAYLPYVSDGGLATDGTTSQLPAATTGSEIPLDTLTGKNTEVFCPLQQASRAVQGLTQETYQKKVYAEASSCDCRICTDQDKAAGACVQHPDDPNILALGSDLPQLYCMDGNQCTDPNNPGQPLAGDYGKYLCPQYCARSTPPYACKLCSDTSLSSSQLYCRIDTGDNVYQVIKPYNTPSDPANPDKNLGVDDWNLIASLPNKDKCCLTESDQSGRTLTYTYTNMAGAQERSELLQFPKQGNPATDCGRTPNTDVLKDCGITITKTSSTAYCHKV